VEIAMFALGRRELVIAGGLVLAGCNSGGGGAASSEADMAIGAESAPATLIEYASVTCSHCREFHETVWDQLKANYIDTGKLRFIFREFPTAPAQVAVAGFQVARCGGATPDQYLERVSALFSQQQAMFASGTMSGVRDALVQVGGAAGLSEEAVMACINDPAGATRIREVVDSGIAEYAITGTPTLILNGQKLEDPSALTYEGLSRLIDAAIG
jgi:protein-disulfide isomerase